MLVCPIRSYATESIRTRRPGHVLVINDIGEFTEVAVSFISMVAGEIILTVRVKILPNQKPWWTD